ncbi:MAG: M20/M25/M40 family metallo-hydrolase [Coriobacteriia bacterium]|nr:M20/M25/M40 family metallo-hydrolase [Coriobacteriia bacterium]
MQKITEMTYPNKVAEDAKLDPRYEQTAKELASDLIKEFLELCKIPHPSKHVDKMRKYLMEWGNREGLETHLDQSGCVYMDVPATAGCESMPKVILQSHYDMVAVAASTYKDFEPTKSPIVPFYDKENDCIHTNWKTSLGADNGQGIATSMAISKLHRNPNNNVKHGPLRLLFTYDEETSMQGVKNLSPEVIDSDYLINLDSIYIGVVLASAAGAFYGTFTKGMQRINAEEKACIFKWTMGGFTGGHSGEDIHKGRGSTIIMLTNFLNRLVDENINFNICSADAGTFMNAIPTKLKLEIIVGSRYVKRTDEIAHEVFSEAQKTYSDGSQLWHRTENDTAYATPMMSISDSLKILDVLKNTPNGVREYWPDQVDYEGRPKPKTSSNIGTFKIKDGNFKMSLLYRSSDAATLDDAMMRLDRLANYHKLDFTLEGIFPAWPKLKENPLNDLFLKSYREACGIEGVSVDIHSGLECGYLSEKFPNLIMASIGCDLCNEHTVKETLFTKSMPTYFASLLYVLEHIGG